MYEPQNLVHALAALALMGLADLWLLMNLSAQFAHARRDVRDLTPGRCGGVGPKCTCAAPSRSSPRRRAMGIPRLGSVAKGQAWV
jgi:hypothetical protein